jgi:hypothetical protein
MYHQKRVTSNIRCTLANARDGHPIAELAECMGGASQPSLKRANVSFSEHDSPLWVYGVEKVP